LPENSNTKNLYPSIIDPETFMALDFPKVLDWFWNVAHISSCLE